MIPYAESQFVDVGDHARIADLRRQGWEVTPLPGYHGVFSMLAWKGEKMKDTEETKAINRMLGLAFRNAKYHKKKMREWEEEGARLARILTEKFNANSKRSRPAKARDKRKAASPKVPKRTVPR